MPSHFRRNPDSAGRALPEALCRVLGTLSGYATRALGSGSAGPGSAGSNDDGQLEAEMDVIGRISKTYPWRAPCPSLARR